MNENIEKNTKQKGLTVAVILLVIGLILLGLFTYNLYQKTAKDEFEETAKVENNTNKKEEIKEDIKDSKMSDEEILTLGKKLYDEAIDVIGNLTYEAEGIVKKPWEFDEEHPGYMKSLVTIDEMRNDILKDFTEEFKDAMLDPNKERIGKDIIRVADNEVFVVDSSKGVNFNYAWRDELEIENATDNKIEFKVSKKYISSDRLGEKLLRKDFFEGYYTYEFLDSDLETITAQFVIVKENGSFKISEFTLPY